MKKTFQCIKDLNLTTTVQGKDKRLTVSFVGGFMYPFRRNGRFSTDNEEIQKAIESDSSYGKDFIQIDASGNPVTNKEAKLSPPADDPIAPVNNPPAANPESDGIKVIGEDVVKNTQDAKKYILDNYKDITPEQVANKNLVMDVAKEKKIRFAKVK